MANNFGNEDEDTYWDCEYPDEESYIMDEFREPAYIDENTKLYTTDAQIRFFLNRPNGEVKMNARCPEFADYITMCEVYNLFYDMSEANNDEGFMYWDEVNGCISFQTYQGSKIQNILKEADIELDFIKDEDEEKGT